jgi:hypothetical protein
MLDDAIAAEVKHMVFPDNIDITRRYTVRYRT